MKDRKTSKALKLLTVMLAVILAAASLTACGSKPEENADSGDDGQNPVMNFIGNYGAGRATIQISADGSDGASAIVTWGSSAWENSTWTMSGTFDEEKLQFEYHDCVKTDYKYSEDGEVESQEEVYTGGHGFMFFKDGDTLSLTWQDDQENIADGTVFEYVGAAPEGGEVGMANPWHDVDTAEEAAKGAGLDVFEAAEGVTISLGDVKVEQYRYMDGMAEAKIPIAAVDMTIRKGRADLAMGDGDISGDYNEYKYNWTQNVKGLEVKCFGNREGEATKTIWQVEDLCWSISAFGAGGDEDFGLNADDLNSLINAIQ